MTGSIHATALVVATPRGPEGLLVTGSSGTGKSKLALAFLDAAPFAMLIADDRVVLENLGGRLIARAPDALAGMIERRGLGIVRCPYLPGARIHRHVVLGGTTERMPDPVAATFESIELPSLEVPGLDGPHGMSALSIVRTWLQIGT